jgi:outer membrane protein assembly factor BamB
VVKAKWRTNLGLGVCSVSIAGKRLYTLGNVRGSDTVYCMDAETGKPVWRFPYPCPAGNFYGPRATPTIDGGLLYTLSRKGDALCLDAESGKIKWAKDLIREFKAQPTDYGLTGSPLIVGDLLFRAHSPGMVSCRKLADGSEVFKERLDGLDAALSPIATADGRLYFAGAGKSYVLKAGAKPEVLGSSTLGDASRASPATAGDRLYLKGNRFLYCIGAKQGAKLEE